MAKTKIQKTKEALLELAKDEREKPAHTFKKISKKTARILRWLRQAEGDWGNPNIKGMTVTENEIICANGFMIFAAPIPEELEDWKNSVRLPSRIAGGESIVDAPIVEGGVLAKRTAKMLKETKEGGEPIAKIRLNAKFLLAALKGQDDVDLVFYANEEEAPGYLTRPIEIYGKDKNGAPSYAFIMPMFVDGSDPDRWRPFDKPE